jgi:1,4-alpha-glucan branching enzyme
VLFPRTELRSLLAARLATPHDVLGMHAHTHRGKAGMAVRAFVGGAAGCDVVEVETGEAWPMKLIAPQGIFAVFIPGRAAVFRYQLRATLHAGGVRQFYDPYAFLPTLGDQDLYLFNEGTEHRIYEKLGAHPQAVDGIAGVAFSVWAPAAKRVSVVGNFNQWDGRYHPLRMLGASGVWELFIPGLGEGELYKFELRDQYGGVHLKVDPFGTYFEPAPNNASIVCDPRKHAWGDAEWIANREKSAARLDRPLSIYEVHLGSWRRDPKDPTRTLSYRKLAPLLADYVIEMGFTHVEVMPLAEHPFDGSWGYQVTGFYAPTQRYGTPEDFAFFVDHLHQRGIGIILDWVPAHFPRDTFALADFDGTHLYDHADPRQGAHMDWGTLIFNYGRNEVRCFLVANALAWCDRYHMDGLRVDAVASMLYLDYSRKEGEWIPNKYGGRENLEAIAFLRETNGLVHEHYPGVLMIAEESTSFPGVTKPVKDGGLGFDLKWNMGWMHDTLKYFQDDPIHRKWHQRELTFAMLYQYSENFVSVLSHDEVVHGKASLLLKMGAASIHEKAANLRALFGHMWAWPGKKLLFMGGEFGQSAEWSHSKGLDWDLRQYLDHDGIRILVRDLNHLYCSEAAFGEGDLTPKSFRWLATYDNQASVIAYLRSDPSGDTLFAVVCHFTPVVRPNYRVGVPMRGFWKEVINTNSQYYGGTGLGNDGGRETENSAADGFPQSLRLTLAPLSVSIFRWTRLQPAKAP